MGDQYDRPTFDQISVGPYGEGWYGESHYGSGADTTTEYDTPSLAGSGAYDRGEPS